MASATWPSTRQNSPDLALKLKHRPGPFAIAGMVTLMAVPGSCKSSVSESQTFGDLWASTSVEAKAHYCGEFTQGAATRRELYKVVRQRVADLQFPDFETFIESECTPRGRETPQSASATPWRRIGGLTRFRASLASHRYRIVVRMMQGRSASQHGNQQKNVAGATVDDLLTAVTVSR